MMHDTDNPSLNPAEQNLRARSRFRMRLECAVFGAGSVLRGARMQTVDVSKAGVSLLWQSEHQPPAVGEPLLIEIDLPSHPSYGTRAMVFETEVVRVDLASDGQVLVATKAQKSGFRESAPNAAQSLYAVN